MRLWDATGPHFFVSPEDIDGEVAVLRGDQARHLAVVLRARSGMAVSLADGVGMRFRAQVIAAEPDAVRLELLDREAVPPPRPSLTVVHALPKGRKLDEVVEKLSEIGVDRLIPVHSARSQVRFDAAKAEKARARWEAVALAAAKQSRRVRPLRIDAVSDWAAAFGSAPGVVLYEESDVPLRDRLGEIDAAGREQLVLAIGPEGGLTPEEVASCGLAAATLGSTILRTETAALAAATATLTLLGRFA